jgi:nitroimidazol reductase NimA-like FMN-containing flavoprotein (pyridoxamine 5'-phosphate oxidase superfamily)
MACTRARVIVDTLRGEASQEDAMSVFTDAEIEYLESQRLGRLATVGHNGTPHVVPNAFRYNPEDNSRSVP